MKTLLTSFFALTSLVVVAQNHLSQHINDNEKTLTIRIQGTLNGKPIDYDRTFDVANLSKAERNAFRERILDSLGVIMPKPPVAPRSPLPPKPPVARESSVAVREGGPTLMAQGPNEQVVAVGGKQPYTKEVKFNPDSGELFLRYRFKKGTEEVLYERTMNARGKSERERQRIVEGIENEIGLPAK